MALTASSYDACLVKTLVKVVRSTVMVTSALDRCSRAGDTVSTRIGCRQFVDALSQFIGASQIEAAPGARFRLISHLFQNIRLQILAS
jgi:hypothetical protein